MALSQYRAKILKEFASKRTQLWQYLNTSIDFTLRDLGLRTTSKLVSGTTDGACFIQKCENESYVVDGVEMDVWKYQGEKLLTPTLVGTNYEIAQGMGTINVSEGQAIRIIEDSSLISALDGGDTVDRTPLANAGTLITLASGATGVGTLMYLTVFNNSTPVTENFVEIIGLHTADWEATAHLDFKFAVQKGATVELEIN